MPVTIISTLQRGGQGDAPFPVIDEKDSKVSYLTVASIADRNAIPEWQRSSGMRVHVLATNIDYRLGTATTIAAQSWTEIAGPTLYQQLSEKNQAGGYVGLEVDGFINPAYLKSIYPTTSYVVSTLAERNALPTQTGDIVVVTGNSKVYVKLNDTSPANNADFAELTLPASVISVNGLTGAVTIDFSSILAQPGSLAAFNAAVSNNPTVTGNVAQIATNSNDIAAIYALLQGVGVSSGSSVDLYEPTTTYEVGDLVVFGTEQQRNLYRVLEGKGPVTGIEPTETFVWEKVGDFYDRDEIDQLIDAAVNAPFDWSRPLKEPPPVGEAVGGITLPEGIENYFYGFRSAVVTANLYSTPIEVGDTASSNIRGFFDPKDHQIVDLLEVRNVGTDSIENGIVFNPPPQTTTFDYDTVPLLGLDGISNSYQFTASVRKEPASPVDQIFSSEINVYGIYPFLTGTSPLDLTQANYYTELTKAVVEKDNLRFSLVGSNDYIYIMYPEEYGDLISIVDQHDDEVLGVLFDAVPQVVTVTSSGLTVDWSKTYRVYKSNVKVVVDSDYYIKFSREEDRVYLIDHLENDLSLHFTKADRDAITAAGTQTPGRVIKNDAVFLPDRQYLNFKGTGVVVTDSLAGDETIITIDTGFNANTFLDKVTYDPTNQAADVFSMDSMVETATGKIFTDLERTKLGNLTDNFKGVYNTEADLIAAYPNGIGGWYAQILQPSATIWIWNTNTSAWENTGAGSTGDMLATIYDPQQVADDVFAMENMIEETGITGTEAKIFLQSERAKLAGLPDDVYSKVEVDALVGSPSGLILKEQTKVGNAFTNFQPIYWDGTTWLIAQADAEATLAIGIVINLVGDDFDVALEGIINLPVHNIALAGESRYLDPDNAGTLISSAPTADNTYSQKILEVIDADNVYIRANSSSIIRNVPLILR